MHKKENMAKEMTLGEFIKLEGVNKGKNLTEVARASGRDQSTLSNICRKNSCTVNVLRDILNAVGEDLILKMADGREIKIVK